MQIKAAANSHGGSGFIQVVATYVGCDAEGNLWDVVARNPQRKVLRREEQYRAQFEVPAHEVAQQYADEFYDELYPINYPVVRRALRNLREGHPGIILVLLTGQYEAWGKDAEPVSQLCGVEVEQREIGDEVIPVAKIPAHALFTAMHQLAQAGKSVHLVEHIGHKQKTVRRVGSGRKMRKHETIR